MAAGASNFSYILKISDHIAGHRAQRRWVAPRAAAQGSPLPALDQKVGRRLNAR